MAIASEIINLNTNLTNSYTACQNKGATIPTDQNFDNLATCIGSITTGGSAVISSLNVTPTTSAQTITAPSGTDGYSPVNVAAVTASIDANITAGNIKKNVQILGVTGTYDGSGSGGGGSERVFNANFWVDTSGVVHNFTDVYGQGKILSANATIIQDDDYLTGCLKESATVIYADLSNIQEIKSEAFQDAFYNSSLEYIDVSNIVTIKGRQSNIFRNSKIKSLIFNSLTSCTGITFMDACRDSYIEEIRFPKLNNPDPSTTPFRRIAYNTKASSINIYFNAMRSSSFGSYSFSNLARGTTGMIIHLPSNLQSVVSSLSEYPLFGGTDTVLSFDLPATS